MTTTEGEDAGQVVGVSQVRENSDDYAFEVFTMEGAPALVFAFADEQLARKNAKLMQSIVADAVAVVHSEDDDGRWRAPQPDFWMSFTWPRPEQTQPRTALEEDLLHHETERMMNFADIRDLGGETPLFPLEAKTLEAAKVLADKIWQGSQNWRPNGAEPVGYDILDHRGFVVDFVEAKERARFFAVPVHDARKPISE